MLWLAGVVVRVAYQDARPGPRRGRSTPRLGFSLMVIATMAKLSELLCRSQPMHEPEVTQPPLDQHDACFQVL
jgi:hypothetical protein